MLNPDQIAQNSGTLQGDGNTSLQVAQRVFGAVWSVPALLAAIGETLAARLGACSVQGELASLTRAGSGHLYFALKEPREGAALLRCVMYRRSAAWLDFTPGDGRLVEVRGRVAIYEPRGDMQFVVEAMRELGQGALLERMQALRAALAAQGLFDADRKRALPRLPRAVGVVTSLDAAALHDVASTLARRAPHVPLVVYPSPVQGAGAVEALARAIGDAGWRREVDVLIVARGGGSLEDLWAFNEEAVVRAIVDAPMPVVSGVGHESDVTLADLAADLRAATPTAAAESVALPRDDEAQALQAAQARLLRAARALLDRQAERLDRAALRALRPSLLLAAQGQRLADLGQRLRRGAVQAVERAGERLGQAQARLAGVDPARVLARGYAWIADASGRPVVSARGVQPGQRVRAVWSDGRATLDVASVEPGLPRTAEGQ